MKNQVNNEDNLRLKKFQSIPDTASDALMDFESWLEETNLVGELFSSRDDEDKFYVILCKLHKRFLLKDEESQIRIGREEKRLLDKWKENVK